MTKQFELEAYKCSAERWAFCLVCDWDFQPRKHEVCPHCKKQEPFQWVDVKHPDMDWADYLKTDEEIEAEDDAPPEGIVGAAWFTTNQGMKDFMDVLGSDLEKIMNSYKGGKQIFLHPFASDEYKDIHGFIVVDRFDISPYDMETYATNELQKHFSEDNSNYENELESQLEYQEITGFKKPIKIEGEEDV